MRKHIDAILLLGLELDAQDRPKPELMLRVQMAAAAYKRLCKKQGKALIIPCGGTLQGHAICEAQVMSAALEEMGVPRADILQETQSQTTMENFRFAAQLLGGAQGRRVLVVTSDYHMRRSLMTARRVGFSASGMSAILPHNEAWKRCARKEWAYTFDLVMGWQDEGRSRPEWAHALFDRVFGKK